MDDDMSPFFLGEVSLVQGAEGDGRLWDCSWYLWDVLGGEGIYVEIHSYAIASFFLFH